MGALDAESGGQRPRLPLRPPWLRGWAGVRPPATSAGPWGRPGGPAREREAGSGGAHRERRVWGGTKSAGLRRHPQRVPGMGGRGTHRHNTGLGGAHRQSSGWVGCPPMGAGQDRPGRTGGHICQPPSSCLPTASIHLWHPSVSVACRIPVRPSVHPSVHGISTSNYPPLLQCSCPLGPCTPRKLQPPS